jgi:hypothetical protein
MNKKHHFYIKLTDGAVFPAPRRPIFLLAKARTGYSVLFLVFVLVSAGTADQPTPMAGASAGAPYENLALMSFKSLITSDPLSALGFWPHGVATSHSLSASGME